MNENRDCRGHILKFPNGNDHKVCYGGQGEYSAKGIATHLNQIPYNTYIEPFLGHGQVYRYINHEGKKEVLNDISCSRVQGAKKNICRTNKACEALETAKVSCGKDYKIFLKKYDQENTLFYLDPPYVSDNPAAKGYRENKLDLNEFVSAVKKVKNADVVISYNNNQDFRKQICNQEAGFECKTIRKKIFGTESTEILAVKK